MTACQGVENMLTACCKIYVEKKASTVLTTLGTYAFNKEKTALNFDVSNVLNDSVLNKY